MSVKQIARWYHSRLDFLGERIADIAIDHQSNTAYIVTVNSRHEVWVNAFSIISPAHLCHIGSEIMPT